MPLCVSVLFCLLDFHSVDSAVRRPATLGSAGGGRSQAVLRKQESGAQGKTLQRGWLLPTAAFQVDRNHLFEISSLPY